MNCTKCGEKAVYETKTNNVYLCESNKCKIEYVEEIIKPISQTDLVTFTYHETNQSVL